LRLLDISGNLITSLDSVIGHTDSAFEELVDMDASDNRLEELPPGMGILRNLKRLNGKTIIQNRCHIQSDSRLNKCNHSGFRLREPWQCFLRVSDVGSQAS